MTWWFSRPGSRHRTARARSPESPACRRPRPAHQGVPSEAPAGRHPSPRVLRLRHSPRSEEHSRFDCAGQGGCFEGGRHALDRLRAHAGAGRFVRPGPLHRVRRLPVRLPARGHYAFIQRPRAIGRQSERLSRVRNLCRRLPDRGDSAWRVLRPRDHGGGMRMNPELQTSPCHGIAGRSHFAVANSRARV